jgi:DNA-binding GntR family transcriptional regulator
LVRKPLGATKGTLFGEDQRVYRSVFDAVMSHRLPPGTKLVESVIAETLDTSRAVVRMGLLRLAHDHIVELRPNRGAAVASPSLRDAHEVYDARRLLEGAIAERMAGELGGSQLHTLQTLVHQGAKAFERGEPLAWIVLAGRFHLELASATGNGVVIEQIRALISRSNLITALYLHAGSTRFSAEERLELVETLRDGSSTSRRQAKRLMEQLLLGVEQRLRVLPARDGQIDLRKSLKAAQLKRLS